MSFQQDPAAGSNGQALPFGAKGTEFLPGSEHCSFIDRVSPASKLQWFTWYAINQTQSTEVLRNDLQYAHFTQEGIGNVWCLSQTMLCELQYRVLNVVKCPLDKS